MVLECNVGKLVIPANLDKSLDQLPTAMYTLLLGIPLDELSRKVPAPSHQPLNRSALAGSSPDTLSDRLADLELGGNKDEVFGTETKDEEVGGFIGAMDLEVLKVTNQQLARLDLELGLFGGLKIIDVSSFDRHV